MGWSEQNEADFQEARKQIEAEIAERTAKLKQERDEAVALAEVMRDALYKVKQCLRDTMPDKSDEGEVDFFILYPTMKPIAIICNEALSITPSAALREIQARTLEEAANAFEWYGQVPHMLHDMAAAKRNGE